MAEQFIIKGIDVMAQESKTALEMLCQERQVIEYYYNKDEDVRNGGTGAILPIRESSVMFIRRA